MPSEMTNGLNTFINSRLQTEKEKVQQYIESLLVYKLQNYDSCELEICAMIENS
jgi:hypothetical protein